MLDQMSPESVIGLPRLDAASAATLGESLQTEAASVKALPASIKSALKPLGKTTKTLHGTLLGRLGSAAKPPSVTRAADVAVDGAVGTLYGWMLMLARLSDEYPEGPRARLWLKEVFPDGVMFIKAPYNKEWAEIETRLTKITTAGYDKEIQEFGGGSILTSLTKAHKAYGEALGITAPRAAGEVKDTAALKDALQAQLQAIRFYVLRVLASIEPDDEDSAALASRLLRPLNEWKSRPPKPAEAPESPAPTPTPVPTPA